MKPYNLSTAIAYANGPPHIGHTLEFIIADVISRYHKINGEKVHFLTGTDEHGQKIENKAKSLGLTPQVLCDNNAALFKKLHENVSIEYDNFIRTSDLHHKKVVNEFYNKCKDDIYLGEYEGWYNPREETFVTLREAESNDFKDPTTGSGLVYSKEPSYFFRLSKYQKEVISHIKNNPDFILPQHKRKEILDRLGNSLEDLSISRTSIKWGIPVPDDPSHVFYVWFDALINYISGGPWPCDLHVIGKDILWFHTTIWLSMLLSAGYELPKHIYVHDFVNDENGTKMSKSLGNVVDPNDLVEKYPIYAIRYYLISRINYGTDLNFSEEALVRSHDSELLEIFGNYVNRVFGLVHRYCGGNILNAQGNEIFDIKSVHNKLTKLIYKVRLQEYITNVIDLVSVLNTHINDTHIWTIGNKKYLEDTRSETDRVIIIKSLIEGLYIVSHYLYPIIPSVSQKVMRFLKTDLTTYDQLSWNNFDDIEITKQNTKIFTIIDTDAYNRRKQKNMGIKN